MKISEGVEWAAHACALLAALPEGISLNAAALAAFNDLPRAYMAKTLQAMARAGVVRAVRGARGGYRLARPAAEVSLWDIRCAIEGPGPDFHCANIRAQGPCAALTKPSGPCAIAHAFWTAEMAMRDSLRATTLAQIMAEVIGDYDAERAARFLAWLESVR